MEVKQVRRKAENLERNLISAIDSMERTDAALQLRSASTSTSARSVNSVDMERWSAKSMRECEELGRRPQYLRHNVFRNDKLWSRSCAEWTEIAHPLPSVPLSEFKNQDAVTTIAQHPELFVVDTPINVSNLERLLARHPNRPFVKSVINSFHTG